MLNANGWNSQKEQGRSNSHRPVHPSTRVAPVQSSREIEEGRREPEMGN